MAGKLFIVATPLGNLGDLTFRAVEVLSRCDVIASEKPEKTRIILEKNGIGKRCLKYNTGNESASVPGLLALLAEGRDVAYVSEAGTPCISDPGYLLVREALAAGIEAVPVPGASAVITLLSVSGLPVDRFAFWGFAPKKKAEMRAFVEGISVFPHTAVFYVSPHNLENLFAGFEETGYDPLCVVGREMTKIHEEFIRGRVSAVREAVLSNPRGEFAFAVRGDGVEVETNIALLLSHGRELMKTYSMKETSRILSIIYDLTKNDIYDILLAGKKNN